MYLFTTTKQFFLSAVVTQIKTVAFKPKLASSYKAYLEWMEEKVFAHQEKNTSLSPSVILD